MFAASALSKQNVKKARHFFTRRTHQQKTSPKIREPANEYLFHSTKCG
jgi:hypothetical protein